MALCKYCGQDAGLLRLAHSECHRSHEQGVTKVRQLVLSSVTEDRDPSRIRAEIEQAARRGWIRYDDTQALVLRTWHEAIDRVVQDGVLASEEEQRINALSGALGYDLAKLPEDAKLKLVMGRVLREVMEGRIPPCPTAVDGAHPFNLQRSEQMVWLFRRVRYIEEKTRRRYVGGSSGMSFRVMKGVYYRVGQSRGRVEEHTSMEQADVGLLGLTTKHLYFAGDRRSLRLPYSKLVTIRPYNNGIGVVRDTATARPQLFVTGNGWFVYNLTMNLSAMAN
ncbi:MAG TPA: hypothetical protein VLH79_16130 [Chthonomonadales bacterium]|nr:hypothetical protein [Chthonomonadales bacterium]